MVDMTMMARAWYVDLVELQQLLGCHGVISLSAGRGVAANALDFGHSVAMVSLAGRAAAMGLPMRSLAI